MPTSTSSRLPLASAGVVGLFTVVLGLLVWVSGVSLADSVLIGAAILWQTVGGMLLWGFARPHRHLLLESLGVGVAVGTVVSASFAAVANAVLPWTWWWVVPTAVLIVIALVRRGRMAAPTESLLALGRGTWVLLGGATAVGFAALTINFRRYPLDGSTAGLFHPDMLFFEALSTSTAQYGGADSAFLAGESIRYHWLAYAWAGQLTNSLNLDVFVMLTRALPLMVLVAGVVLVVSWSRALSTVWWVPWLATALLVTGGYLGAVNGTVLNFDSPSQSLTALWLIALIFILTQWLRSQLSSPVVTALVIFVLSIGLAAGKGSAGAVAVGAFGIAGVLALALLRGETTGPVVIKRLWIAFALAALAFGLSYVLLLSGNASSGGLQFLTFDGHASTAQGLDSSPTNRGVIFGTLGLLLAMSARFIGVLGWFTTRADRRSPEALISIGLIVSGLVPVVIFSESINETWFALAVSAPLSVLSAVGVGTVVSRVRIHPVLIVLVALVTFVAVSYVWTDQVWESGFGRFYAPWLGYVVAGIVAVVIAVTAGSQRMVAAIAAFTLILTVGASLARFTPAVAAALGGAREGVGVGVADFADLPVRNQPVPTGIEVVSQSSVDSSSEVDEVAEETNVAAAQVPITELYYWNGFDVPWGSAELEFATRVRRTVPPTSLIATNDLFYPLVPALSNRMTYLSATRYQELYGTVAGNEKIPSVKENVRAFFSDPNKATAAPLCAASVEWLWLVSPDPAAYLAMTNMPATLVLGENALVPFAQEYCDS